MRRPQDTASDDDEDEEVWPPIVAPTGCEQKQMQKQQAKHYPKMSNRLEQQSKWPQRRLVGALLLPLALLQLLNPVAHCLGSEDLNSSSNKQHPSIRSIHTPTFKHSFQRPLLSNRFNPSLHGAPVAAPVQHQHLATQASFSASIFSEPPASASQASTVAGSVSNVSNIEQMMKNALARTVHLNSAASEPAAVVSEVSAVSSGTQPETGREQPPTRSRAGQQQVPASSVGELESLPNSRETTTKIGADESGDSNKLAIGDQADPSGAANGHETVYSEQRFANLFARRNSLKKSRLQPFEQVKARPTLPSFIKSLPDPKQFSAIAAASATSSQLQTTDTRPLAGSNSFVQSPRLQQQQQQQAAAAAAKINLANQAKKASITSNSANIANNKRASSLAQNGTANKSALGPKSSSNKTTPSAAINKSSSSSTSAALSASNPFSRSSSQPTSSDPANVIAMARKRLLANNALESAKLKQQQQQQMQKQQASSSN